MPGLRRRSATAASKASAANRALLAAVWVALAVGAVAGPPLTAIDDLMYNADGSRFNGIAYIEWKQFTASDLSYIAPNVTSVQIIAGVIKLQLVPTTTAPGGAYYLVKFYSGGRMQFTEAWAVPPSLAPLRLADVRISSSGGGGSSGGSSSGVTLPITISDVTGLSGELSLRPSKGAAFVPSRVAIINPSGAVDAATGNLTDCVRVDGTAGPCGAPSSAGPGFVDSEIPTGLVNGTNGVFSLRNAPDPPESLQLYRNGLLMARGLDYTASGPAITFVASATPQAGDLLAASYRVADPSNPTGSGALTVPQVMCSTTGTSTSATSLTRLGSCTIPAGYLAAGDRFEIRANYAHQGTATGFTVEIRWGSTPILARSAAATETALSANATAGVHASGTSIAGQSWGASLAVAATAGNATDALGSGVTIDLLGGMASAGADSVALRSFSVVRHPARVTP